MFLLRQQQKILFVVGAVNMTKPTLADCWTFVGIAFLCIGFASGRL